MMSLQVNHLKECSKVMYMFQQQGRCCDVSIVTGNDDIPIHAHSIVLASASQYFRQLFTEVVDPSKGGCQVKMQTTNKDLVNKLIKFIYTGEMELPVSLIKPVMTLSEELQVHRAVTVCHALLSNISPNVSGKDSVSTRPNVDRSSTLQMTKSLLKKSIVSQVQDMSIEEQEKEMKKGLVDRLSDNKNQNEMKLAKVTELNNENCDDSGENYRETVESELHTIGRSSVRNADVEKIKENVTSNRKQMIHNKTQNDIDIEMNKDEGLYTEKMLTEENVGQDKIKQETLTAECQGNTTVQKLKDSNSYDNESDLNTSDVSCTFVKKNEKVNDTKITKESNEPKHFADEIITTIKKETESHNCETATKSEIRECPRLLEKPKVEMMPNETEQLRFRIPEQKFGGVNENNVIDESQTEMSHKEYEDMETVDTKKREIKKPKCSICGMNFLTVRRLQIHHRSHHPDHKASTSLSNVCACCSYVAASNKLLQIHMKHKHSVPFESHQHKHIVYSCQKEGCTFQTLYKPTLTKHEKGHLEVRPYVCETCGRSFKQKPALESHNLIHSNSKPYTCHICDGSYRQQSTLKIHILRKHGDKKFPKRFLCDQCDYQSWDKGSLNMHLFSMHGTKMPEYKLPTYKCEYCCREFLRKCLLESHIRRHKDERPFSCTTCGKSFITKHELKSHERWHNERTYRCEQCEFAAVSKIKLSEHMDVMHLKRDQRDFQCEMCEYQTNIKGNLTKHIRAVHKVMVPMATNRITRIGSAEKSSNEVEREEKQKSQVIQLMNIKDDVILEDNLLMEDSQDQGSDTCNISYIIVSEQT